MCVYVCVLNWSIRLDVVLLVLVVFFRHDIIFVLALYSLRVDLEIEAALVRLAPRCH